MDDGVLVHIMRESIMSMDKMSVHLSNDQTIQSDAIIFATGWVPSHNCLFDQDSAAELGLPIPLNTETPADASYWQNLQASANRMVLHLYPKLQNPPFQPPPKKTTPWRLFRTMVSPKLAAAHDYSLAFVGLISNNQVSTHAEISALWAVAYLEGKLSHGTVGRLLDDKLKMDVDVAAMTTFMARRYLGRKEVPDAAMEIQDYTDQMMRDLGLRADRKRMRMPAGWFGYQAWKAEWFTPYTPQDYRGVVREFLGNATEKTG